MKHKPRRTREIGVRRIIKQPGQMAASHEERKCVVFNQDAVHAQKGYTRKHTLQCIY